MTPDTPYMLFPLPLCSVTGTSKIPLDGFKALQGTNGITRFQIQRASGVDRLPAAHTCFNQLVSHVHVMWCHIP